MTSLEANGPAYAVRSSLFDAETNYRLGPDAIEWDDKGSNKSIPYADVSEIRLIKYPSAGGEQGQMTVRSRGHSKLNIRSHHYRSLGSFESRMATYAPFVRDLTRRVAAASPHARFLAGSTGYWVLWVVLLVLAVLVGGASIIMLASGADNASRAIAPLLVLGILGPGMWRLVRRGQGSAFDPLNPPPEYLSD